jgi:ABC-type multidrug transport system ATPase subunit
LGVDAPLYRVRGLRWQLGDEFRLQIDALELPRGQTTLLLGPSASGKSTLLALLGRVEGDYFADADPLERTGEIWLDDGEGALEILSLGERALLKRRLRGRRVGYVFQREGLFPDLGVLDNVAWPLRALGTPAPEAVARAELLLDRVGLEPGRQVATLSGGERKRLALARALGPDPRVLLCDEPLTGLDPRAVGGLLDLLASLSEEPARSMVMVTHQPGDIARLGSYVVLMHRGQVAAAGTREELASELEAFVEGRWER